MTTARVVPSIVSSGFPMKRPMETKPCSAASGRCSPPKSSPFQEKAGGIAEALHLTREFVSNRNVVVILGDNVFEESMRGHLMEFENDDEYDCYLFLKEVNNPSEFGIAWLDDNGSITHMLEKPDNPDSNMAITGLYFYSNKVFDLIDKSIEEGGYSSRGELEITDINRYFMETNRAKGIIFQSHWADCGTIDALLETSVLVKNWQQGPWLISKE